MLFTVHFQEKTLLESFSDCIGSQYFSASGHERLLFLIIGSLINKRGVYCAGTFIKDCSPIESQEHRVTLVQRLPITVLHKKRQKKEKEQDHYCGKQVKPGSQNKQSKHLSHRTHFLTRVSPLSVPVTKSNSFIHGSRACIFL